MVCIVMVIVDMHFSEMQLLTAGGMTRMTIWMSGIRKSSRRW